MNAAETIPRDQSTSWGIGGSIVLGVMLFWWLQPLAADLLVPIYGGGAEVWTACMLFFQLMVLAGYLYAHLLTRLFSAKAALLTHGILVGCIAAMVSLDLSGLSASAFRSEPSPTGVFRDLLVMVGLPSLALSATSPMFQFAYFSVTQRAPWRLYALANGVALILLLGHPLLIEPLLANSTQRDAWAWAFSLFCLMTLWVGLRRRPSASLESHTRDEHAGQSLPWWLLSLLAACASGLLLTTSEAMSRDVASIPMLWAWPLAVFLLTLIVTFDRPQLYNRWWALGLMLAGTLLLSTVRIYTEDSPLPLTVIAHLFFLFAGCNLCHGELYRGRPPASKLTGYHLAMATGGALGGLFIGGICPMLFDRLVELPLMMLSAFAVFALSAGREQSGRRVAAWTGVGVIVVATLVAGIGLFALSQTTSEPQRVVERTRNLHGTLTLIEREANEGQAARRLLVDGNTTHGMQYLGLPGPPAPTLYYAPITGIGEAIARVQSVRPGGANIAVIGLGVGTVAAYARAQDSLTFLEINPAVERAAREQFDFLKHAPPSTQVLIGDGRQLIERHFETDSLDLIIVDAFSSDAIPVHLLTREALSLYRDRLKEGGLIAFHITNRYLDLKRVLAPMSQGLGLEVEVYERKGFATWLLASVKDGAVGEAASALWSDDHAPLWMALKW